ncbi:MAG: cadherin-like beta sandwich domain-containing protein, partial [Myxococcales bacterium]|nr:cadherin-like beta sandwich domain-containing protein [Myxococcales bacterium]
PAALERCDGVDQDCDGVIDGAAAAARCSLPGALSSTCLAGVCVAELCEVGLGDCDAERSNGCEAPLLSSVWSCGSCGTACADSHGLPTCELGVCGVSFCEAGWHECDGACVADDSSDSCGTRCLPCPDARTDGRGTSCNAGACGVVCASARYLAIGLDGASPDCVWDDPTLSSLRLSAGTLMPSAGGPAGFVPEVLGYAVQLDVGDATLSLMPTSAAPDAASEIAITLDGAPIAAGVDSAPIPIPYGLSIHELTITAESGATLTYRLEIRRGRLEAGAYLKAATIGPDEFGSAIAIHGDRVAVGSWREDSAATGIDGDPLNDGATDSGAVTVFARDPATGLWAQEAYLKASNAEAGDHFGASVAIEGDRLVVGAPLEDGGGVDPADNSRLDSGAIYVFERDPATGAWAERAYLKASNADASDRFGSALDLSGDRILVGAPLEAGGGASVGGDPSDNSLLRAGAAYLLRRVAGSWISEAYLKASNANGGDHFGASLALDGARLVIGAAMERSCSGGAAADPLNNSCQEAGAAYVFGLDEATGLWGPEAYLTASYPSPFDRFGASVAIHGEHIVVGMPGDDSPATSVGGEANDDRGDDHGSAFVFVRDPILSSWSEEAYLKPSNAGALDQFGTAVAIDGERIVIGAPYEASLATGIDGVQTDDSRWGAGAAYLFTRDGSIGSWSQFSYIKGFSADAYDSFGHALGIEGMSVAVGSPLDDSAATGVGGDFSNNDASSAGAVCVYELR